MTTYRRIHLAATRGLLTGSLAGILMLHAWSGVLYR